MPGYVTYDVQIKCPHCDKELHLNQYPYNDDTTDYGDTDDVVGMMLFGGPSEPAKWENLSVPIKCCGCKKVFKLGSFQT